MYFKLLFFVFCAMLGTACGFRCYACSFSSVDADQSCLTITNETHIVNCPFTYCVILRQEFMDPAGVIASFIRGCEEQPDYLNHEVVDSDFRTFYRACTSDLCNTGNGVQSVVGGVLSPRPEYNGENLLVPGTGSGNHAGKVQVTSLMILIFGVIIANVF
ncbi:uncharacterized protein LOC135074960 [Ostrinia nubilalis]|uniref:uncharacterized protein LOC135074960 n=1 Tax=Ostrinia nubilalis TaxID=29057 RepID=UPI0030823F65